MFLLTEGPRLFYVDAANMVLKGEIPWLVKHLHDAVIIVFCVFLKWSIFKTITTLSHLVCEFLCTSECMEKLRGTIVSVRMPFLFATLQAGSEHSSENRAYSFCSWRLIIAGLWLGHKIWGLKQRTSRYFLFTRWVHHISVNYFDKNYLLMHSLFLNIHSVRSWHLTQKFYGNEPNTRRVAVIDMTRHLRNGEINSCHNSSL